VGIAGYIGWTDITRYFFVVALFDVEGDLRLGTPLFEDARGFFFGVLNGGAFDVEQFVFEFEHDRAVAPPLLAYYRNPGAE
jgi:hypothetical protein